MNPSYECGFFLALPRISLQLNFQNTVSRTSCLAICQLLHFYCKANI